MFCKGIIRGKQWKLHISELTENEGTEITMKVFKARLEGAWNNLL